jgi:Flp pilus assembly protein TadG
MAILFGVIELGRFVFTDSILSQGAREGARLAAVEASWIGSSDASCGAVGGPVCPANATTLATHVTTAANRMVAGLGGSIVNVFVSCDPPGVEPTGAWTGTSCSNRGEGDVVSIRLDFTYQPIIPILGPVTRQGAATMVIN